MIYHESQIGNYCRLHSLNAFFGFKKYSINEFSKFCDEYDIINKNLYNINSSCKTFDLISSNQQNIISYILKKNFIYSKFYPLNFLYQSNNIIKDEEILNKQLLYILEKISRFFIYNQNHIWVIKKYNNEWYEIDSLRGVNKIYTDIFYFIKNNKNIGYIMPINPYDYFIENLKIIKINIYKTNYKNINNLEKCNIIKYIKNYLINNNKRKKILDNIEIPLNICIDILEFNFLKKKDKYIFNPIKDLIDKYKLFLSKFTNKNYNNIDLILDFLPEIIYNLIKLKI